MAETHGLSSDTSAIQSPEVGSSLTPAGTAAHCGTGTSLLRVMAGGLGRFCTGPSPLSTLPLRQCAALTVSTDCSQVQRAELGSAHRAARPYSKLPSCAMCRGGRCQGCRQRGVGGAAQPSIVWPSPTLVEQEPSSADDGVRLASFSHVRFIPFLLVFRRSS